MANGLLKRFEAADQIQYILLAGSRENSTIFVPDALSNGTLEFLQHMPKAVRQFLDPIGWHKQMFQINALRHYNFNVVFDGAPPEMPLAKILSNRLTCIFLHSISQEYWQAIREYSEQCLILSGNKKIADAVLNDPTLKEIYCADLIQSYKRLKKIILLQSGGSAQSLDNRFAQNVEILKKRLEETGDIYESDFRACEPNTRTFYQLLAPYGIPIFKVQKTEHSQRPKALVESAERVLKAYSSVTAITTVGRQIVNPPLILIWPYYDPTFTKICDQKSTLQNERQEKQRYLLQKVASLEQIRETYEIHSLDEAILKSSEFFLLISKLHINLTAYLDNIGYLHSSFQDSPVVRMPITGKSLNNCLSRFHPSRVGHLMASKKAHRQLLKCGREFAKRFPPKILEHIDKFYDQLVAISDLPVEWTLVDEVPLAFLVDICRLPQTVPSSLMAQYVSNATFEYSIKSNILEKTLVICGCDTSEYIGRAFDVFRKSITKNHLNGVQTVRCLSKNDFISAIEDIKPDLLIIDSHGDYTNNSEGSLLKIGSERIVGQDIVTIKHKTPLVILSSCFTAPVYGCTNIIAQAFFENLTRSVLSTYLPISTHSANILYQRMLINLETAVKEPLHRNWLSFVSHNLRTAHIDEYLALLSPYTDPDLSRRHKSQWMVHSMIPSKRRDDLTPEVRQIRSIVLSLG